MKLPEFRSAGELTQASKSTSMSGAFMKPQLRPQTLSHQAATHNLNIRQYSEADERAAAVSKYSTVDNLITAGTQILGMIDKIDTGRQQMATEAAAAEYTQKMANLTADEVMNANMVVDEKTGAKRWESSDQTYSAAKDSLMKEMEKKYRITRNELKHDLQLKIQAADHTNGKQLRSSQHKGMITAGFVDYQTAYDNTASVMGRKDLTKKAFDAGYITAEAYTGRLEKLDHEQMGIMYSGRIQSDISGESSRHVIQELNTPQKILNKGLTLQEGQRYRNQAIDRVALIMADNVRQKVQQTKSRATIDAEIQNLTLADAEYYGLEQPEDINRLRDGVIGELNQIKSSMKAAETISATKSRKAHSYNSFDVRSGLTMTKGTQPMNTPNSQESFKDWMDDRFYAPVDEETGEMPTAMDAVELWGGEGYEKVLAASIPDGAIDKKGAKRLGNAIGNWQDVEKQMESARIVNKLMTDPRVPAYMRDEYANEIGQDNVDFAIALQDGTISAEGIKDWNAYSLNKGDQENIDLVFNAYTSEKGYSAEAQVREAMDIDEDMPSHVIAPIIADYERTFKLKHQGQRGGAQMSTYEKQAMVEVANRWTLEKQGVLEEGWFSDTHQFKAVQGSLYNDMNSLDGTANEAVGQIVGYATTVSGNGKILELAAEGSTNIVPTQWGPKEDKTYMLMYTVTDDDGNVNMKPMQDAETKLPVFVSGKEAFNKQKAEAQFQQSVQEGEKIMEDLNDSDQFDSDVQKNRQAVKDFFVKAGKGVKQGSEIMDEGGAMGVIQNRTADYVGQSIRDGIASWFVTDVEDISPAYLERLMTAESYHNMNLSKEANDHIWKNVVEYREKQMLKMNKDAMARGKTPSYSKEQYEANLAKIKNVLTSRGLVDPVND